MNETIDKRAKQLGYRTELRTPIERPRPLLVALSGDTEERIVNRQIWGKLGLLMGHYGINAADPYGLMYLAEHLARDWVPGCMVENKIKRGAPIKITPMALTQLFLAIEQIRTEGPQQPLYEACKTFLSRNKTDPVWGKNTTRSLANSYSKGKQQFEQSKKEWHNSPSLRAYVEKRIAAEGWPKKSD